MAEKKKSGERVIEIERCDSKQVKERGVKTRCRRWRTDFSTITFWIGRDKKKLIKEVLPKKRCPVFSILLALWRLIFMSQLVKMRGSQRATARGDTTSKHTNIVMLWDWDSEGEQMQNRRGGDWENKSTLHLITQPLTSFLCHTPHFEGQSVKLVTHRYSQLRTDSEISCFFCLLSCLQ